MEESIYINLSKTIFALSIFEEEAAATASNSKTFSCMC